MPSNSTIAVVGATGVVGREALSILHSRGVHRTRILALASERSIGVNVRYGADELPIHLARPGALHGVCLALLCADANVSRTLSPVAVREGALVVDNSSAFRLDSNVPLVVPEINGALAKSMPVGGAIIATPNCSVVILLIALEPLRQAFGVRSIQLATYQAVSGAGQGGIDDLTTQVRAIASGKTAPPSHFHEPCAMNVFSHDSAVDPYTGVNGEERKIIDESRKIWNDPTLRITPTCVRVPVFRAHTQAITVELNEPVEEVEVRRALASGQGLTVIDDRIKNSFPTPLNATGQDDILVGRVRHDPAETPDAHGRNRRWCLLVCGDQLRKGAAGNAIQIAELAGRLAP